MRPEDRLGFRVLPRRRRRDTEASAPRELLALGRFFRGPRRRNGEGGGSRDSRAGGDRDGCRDGANGARGSHGDRGGRPRSSARNHARYRGRVFESRFLPKAHLMSSSRTSLPTMWSRRWPTRLEAGTSRVTGSAGRRRSSASPTTEPASGSRRSMLHDDQGARHCRRAQSGSCSPPSW